MRKTIFAIFAHPDDESFGPGGTIALLSKTHDVYLLCATKGESGLNHSKSKKGTAEKRTQELRNSAKILGVKKVFFLGFHDGELSNNKYHSLAEKITILANKLKPETILTYESRGISGHIDHITVSLVASYVFSRHSYIKELYYYCLSEKQRGTEQNYFIYFPPGYPDAEITKRVDISSVVETKIRAIRCHTSQVGDVKKMIHKQKTERQEECFVVIRK